MHRHYRSGMSNYRSFATTRTGRKRIFTTFPEYFQQIMKNRQKKISHPKMDFSWSAMLVHKICTCTREIYVVSEPEYSVHWIICVSLLPQNRKHLRATAGRIHVDPIFPKAREYPCAYVSCSLPIKYIWTYGISSWSDNWNICLNSEWNLTETENHIRFQVQVIRE